jgi:phosphoribosyl-ATP pyrophosphohydrolase
MFYKLFQIITDRKNNPLPDSYTNALFNAGANRIAQKVGEESIELVIAAGNPDKQRIIEETSDLIYHLFVLLVYNDISLADIEDELEKRHFKREG